MYVVFDIETNGLSKSTDDILTFAYLIIDDDNGNTVLEADELKFYYTGLRINPEAFAVNHISLEDLKPYEADFDKNCRTMFRVLEKANVVGYNSKSFDLPFVSSFLTRNGYPALQEYSHVDCLSAAKKYLPGGKHKLVDVATRIGLNDDLVSMMNETYFGEKSHTAHTATVDVTKTNLVYMHLKRLAGGNL